LVELGNAIDTRAIAELRANIGGDGEFLVELIDEFLVDAPVQLESLRVALGSADAEGARRAAHTLKGTSRTFGADALGSLCQEVESTAGVVEFDASLARLDEIDAEWARVRSELLAARANAL
jgi:HPt (histidine-containing phosphotransfer) domain-containing protein